MRRTSSLVLLALAVFFAALSPLIRWYAFPRLAKIPAGQYQAVVLEAKNATLLDYSTMQPKKVPKVTIVQTLRGNVDGITPHTVRAMGMERWYTTKRMFWVEPVTGAPVNGEEIHQEQLRYTTGHQSPVTVFAGHVKMRSDYIDHTVALVKSQRPLVLYMTSRLPWGFLGLGAALLALSLFLEARGRVGSRAGAGQLEPAPNAAPVNA
jgi:hypothetical protein